MRILITGTSSGIGKGIAEKFLSEGHCVTGFDRKEATIQHTAYTHIHMDIRDKTHFPALEPFVLSINNCRRAKRRRYRCKLKRNHRDHRNLRHPSRHPRSSHDRLCQRPQRLRISGICGQQGRRPLLRQKRRPSLGQLRRYLQQPGFRRCPDRTNKPVMEDKALWNQIMDVTPLKRWMTVEETADWAYFMTVTNRFCTGQNILIDGLEAGNAHFVWPEE